MMSSGARAAHAFGRPVPLQAKVWRVVSFAKLCELMDRAALHCARIDQFADAFEGRWPAADTRYWEYLPGAATFEDLRKVRRHAVASCWVESPSESAATWRLYGTDAECVAIASRFGALVEASAQQAQRTRETWIAGGVEYLDYERKVGMAHGPDDPYRQSIFKVLACKHAAYSSESEVRIIGMSNESEFAPAGAEVQLDLGAFVEELVVSPAAQDWFYELVRKIAGMRNLAERVRRSELRGAM